MKLDELKALAQKATPGPWVSKFYQGDDYPMIKLSTDTIEDISRREDADYIAALSPERVLALIACVEAADTMREWFRHSRTVKPPIEACDRARTALEQS